MERDFAANGAEAARLLHLLHEVGLKGQKLAVSHVTKKAAQVRAAVPMVDVDERVQGGRASVSTQGSGHEGGGK